MRTDDAGADLLVAADRLGGGGNGGGGGGSSPAFDDSSCAMNDSSTAFDDSSCVRRDPAPPVDLAVVPWDQRERSASATSASCSATWAFRVPAAGEAEALRPA